MIQLISAIDALAMSVLGQAEAVTSTKIESVWDFVVKGGPTMIAIGVCSLLALSVIVERALLLRRRNVIPPHFINGLKAVSSDSVKAVEYCEADGSAAARILAAIFRHRGRPIATVMEAVKETGQREMVKMRRRMRLISVLPQISTMLGLLGTIFGMIKTFQAVAASGQSLGKTEVLAKGIFEAWANTAAGLLVAIPILIAYHVLMGRLDDVAAELDRVAGEWIERETNPVAEREVRSTAPAHVAAVSAVVAPTLAVPVGA